VQRLETKLVRLNRAIVADQEMIQVLNAEWSYLNQPQNLETLSRRFLELEPITGKQFTTIEQIPMRGAPGGGAAVVAAKSASPPTAPPHPNPSLDEEAPITSTPIEEPITPVAATRSTPAPIARTAIGGTRAAPAPRGTTPMPPPLPPRAVQPQGVPR